MTRSLATNLAMVRRVAERLGDLRDQVVFLNDSRFLDALPRHLLLDQASQQRIADIKST